MPHKKNNRKLLLDRLGSSFIDSRNPVKDNPINTSQLQGMATLLASELLALASGAGDCPKHPGLVDGACAVCWGVWDEKTYQERHCQESNDNLETNKR